ncbi:beta-glucosidase 6 [Coccomyxa sp. Obi]|nr:beta-glucosidase 6 [Coccomyxa sp. Obi]
MEKPTFLWGVASAAYQVEGAYKDDGRGMSIWDTFSHTVGKTAHGHNGDVAVDFYHRYEADIAMMRSLGVKMFRFSISWPRILPQGTGRVNKLGVQFYSKLIDALLAAGIEPHVTLYHWDLPQALQDKFGGWLSEKSIKAFAGYAEVCFKAFGDRVRYWTTFNEPWSFIFIGYGMGIHAPGRCSDRQVCVEGDSSKEPWVVTHNVLLAHAAAVEHFRALMPHGNISINLNAEWSEPLTSSVLDKEAAQRNLDFILGIYADPIFLGDYPATVRARVPDLPEFTAEQRASLKGSADYFALNHYTSRYVSHDDASPTGAATHTERNGKAIGKQADSEWLVSVPWGFRKLLSYVHRRYSAPEVWITENGCDAPGEDDAPFPAVLDDTFRVEFFQEYLAEAMKAVREDGVNIKGYFAWSILDNFEWADGYTKRFGIVYVDYKNGLLRHLKASAKYLAALFSPEPLAIPTATDSAADLDTEPTID